MFFEFNGTRIKYKGKEYANISPEDASIIGLVWHIGNKNIESLIENIKENKQIIEFELENFGYKGKKKVKLEEKIKFKINFVGNNYYIEVYKIEKNRLKSINYEELVNLWLKSYAKTK